MWVGFSVIVPSLPPILPRQQEQGLEWVRPVSAKISFSNDSWHCPVTFRRAADDPRHLLALVLVPPAPHSLQNRHLLSQQQEQPRRRRQRRSYLWSWWAQSLR